MTQRQRWFIIKKKPNKLNITGSAPGDFNRVCEKVQRSDDTRIVW